MVPRLQSSRAGASVLLRSFFVIKNKSSDCSDQFFLPHHSLWASIDCLALARRHLFSQNLETINLRSASFTLRSLHSSSFSTIDSRSAHPRQQAAITCFRHFVARVTFLSFFIIFYKKYTNFLIPLKLCGNYWKFVQKNQVFGPPKRGDFLKKAIFGQTPYEREQNGSSLKGHRMIDNIRGRWRKSSSKNGFFDHFSVRIYK